MSVFVSLKSAKYAAEPRTPTITVPAGDLRSRDSLPIGRLRHVPMVAKLVSSRTRIQSQVCLMPKALCNSQKVQDYFTSLILVFTLLFSSCSMMTDLFMYLLFLLDCGSLETKDVSYS